MTAWTANPSVYPQIRMQGQSTGQRSTLTMNHGSYYVDTTLSAATQAAGNSGPYTKPVTTTNVFLPGHAYYLFVLYAKPSLHQIYSFYIGPNLSEEAALATVTTGIVNPFAGTTPTFSAKESSSPDWITARRYDRATGVLSVTLDLSAQTSVFDASKPQFCQPATYCSVHADNSCGCKPGSGCTEDSVCSWGTKELDCPVDGCFGFSVTLPATFKTAEGNPIPPPAPVSFANSGDAYFNAGNVKFFNVPEAIAGAQCFYNSPPVGSPSPRAPGPRGKIF